MEGVSEGLCGQFSLAEMKIATNNFNDKLLLGEGDFGSVYKGSIDDRTRIVAIKWLKFKPGQGENILVFEFIVKGNLFRRLHYTDHDDHDRLSWKQRLQIRIGVALALHYLHIAVKQTIIHGDVKPADILLDENWEFKLSDFKSFKMLQSVSAYTWTLQLLVCKMSERIVAMNEMDVGLEYALELQESVDAARRMVNITIPYTLYL
ncbi:putative receptor-like protein kinase At5g39000 [Quercus robur]|uniref:putative receptor-like protein kinase At5g39000 n=1 Tax=Quercus robur TaxID=38942 RepID=UPI00216350A3|nr:putative receptor-like protein kinase At5g39000 [Quercus robur]